MALLLTTLLTPSRAAIAADDATEIRVLIDASGSMKTNDPANLRAPSLRLLARLLPDGVRAGVWQFGDDITELMPPGPVDESWRRKAVERVRRIGSRDMFTDVEAALITATADWARPRPGVRREIILLTDGIIDVADGRDESAASRKRLLSSQLAHLRQAGVTINTIALSRRADADLMQALSRRTGGYHETIANANGLERAFLRMFESSTSPDSVPIRDDGFVIDDGIREVTLVVFRRPGDRPVRLTPPDGEPRTKANAGDNIRWESDEGYDLITITAPDAGRWQIDARQDPDNRALILTDLQLRTTELAGTTPRQKPRKVRAVLLNAGERVDAAAVLDSTVFSLTLIAPDARRRELPLRVSERSGAYTGELPVLNAPGRYEVIVTAESPTFVRERRQSLMVPTSVANAEGPASDEMAAEADDTASDDTAPLQQPAGHGEVNYSPGDASDAETEEAAAADPAETRAPAHEADGPDGADHAGHGDDTANSDKHNASADDGTEDDTESGSTPFNSSMLTNIALVLGFNALLGGGGYFAYRRWKRHRATVGATVEAL